MTTISSILHILCAYNRLWIPDRKWTNDGIQDMIHKPPTLMHVIDLLLTSADPHVLLPTMRTLMLDTLRVIADEFTVDDLISGLEGITFMGI